MTSPTGLFCPPEYVLAAWIRSIGGFTADSIDPILPADDTTWKTNGAVTMFVVGGTEHPYMAVSNTVLQVETWTCNPGSDKPKWLESRNLASQIRLACLDRVSISRALQVTVNGMTYPGASVRGISLMSTPRRAYGMKDDYAGHLFDVAMTWTQLISPTR